MQPVRINSGRVFCCTKTNTHKHFHRAFRAFTICTMDGRYIYDLTQNMYQMANDNNAAVNVANPFAYILDTLARIEQKHADTVAELSAIRDKIEITDPGRLITIKQTAALWGCSEMTVRRAYKAGDLVNASPDNFIRFRYADVLAYIEERAENQ